MSAAKSSKTILVVDDDPSVLAFVSGLMVDSGYNVLSASSGSAGLQLSRECKQEIHLLISDFQMPGGMSGIDLATAMTLDRPNVKVLLMSGFDGGTLILNDGWHFIEKPFIVSQLRALMITLLDPDMKSRFAA